MQGFAEAVGVGAPVSRDQVASERDNIARGPRVESGGGQLLSSTEEYIYVRGRELRGIRDREMH
eukprot:6936003-Prymnesium_polylepis.1